MLISIDWICDFVDLRKQETSEIAKRFTLGSAEVEKVVEVGEHLKKIRVAEVIEINPHPKADKLRLVTFNFGGSEPKEVVCGAPNVKMGMKTPFAPNGTTLPNGLTLEPKKIRGVLSDGMLCSEEELGLSHESSGIMELPEQTRVGMTLQELWDQKPDVLLDIDNKSLTHRPDMWGHFGVAREFAALFETELQRPFNESWANDLKSLFDDRKSPIAPQVDKDSSCLAYYGLTVEGVEVGESPKWMQERLNAVGLRPINNIVDISNYVMLELGIPLHIFDRQKIQNDTIHIKRVGKKDTFQTLDEVERELEPSDTVICDSEKPLVLAGIMGGLNSGVSEETNEVFIEVANWKAAEVRKTSTRLGLRTDSSQRYEKTLDSQLCERTLLRTLELLREVCPKAKVVGEMEYDGDDLSQIPTLEIPLSVDRVSKVLGVELSRDRIKDILTRLDFGVEGKGDHLQIEVPSFRATKDIEYEADLIEEIGRIIGYDHIEPVSPKLDVSPTKLTSAQELHRRLRDFMVLHGKSFEIMTYPMIGEKLLQKCGWPRHEKDDKLGALRILNSLSSDAEIMRPSLIPSFLDVASTNTKHFDEFRFFELGRSYHPDEKSFATENSQLGVCFYGRNHNPFMDLVNCFDHMLEAMNLPADMITHHPKFKSEVVDEDWNGLHPFEFYNVRLMGKMKGSLFSVHPLLLRHFKIKGHLAIGILDLTQVEAKPLKDKVKYKPLPKFPGSSFDWTVLADKGRPVEDIYQCLKKIKIKEMSDVSVVDVFPLNDEQNAITLRAFFQDPETTLSGDFLTQARDQLVHGLEKNGFPLKT